MRIIELRPETTPFKAGKTHRASSWRAEDYRYSASANDGADILEREVWHYSTRMVVYTSTDHGVTWTADVVSTGHGSVSDQNGVNQLTSVRYSYARRELSKDYGWRYSRRGGASVEYVGPETAITDPIAAGWPVHYV